MMTMYHVRYMMVYITEKKQINRRLKQTTCVDFVFVTLPQPAQPSREMSHTQPSREMSHAHPSREILNMPNPLESCVSMFVSL